MKLRNKQTGEIGNLVQRSCEDERIWVWIDNISKPEYRYTSLAELNAEWEDYEEPKDFWFIDPEILIACESTDPLLCDKKVAIETMKQIGNYFETREEAEKAVEKLRAYKRLKDKQFKFYGWNKGSLLKSKPNTIEFACDDTKLWSWEDIQGDLDLLFGGEE